MLQCLVKGTAALCTCRKECNKYDQTAAQCFWLAHHNDWSRWFPISSPRPYLLSWFQFYGWGRKRVDNWTWMWNIFWHTELPLFNKISWLCGQQTGGVEASNEGCNSGPTGHDFTDNSIIYPQWHTHLQSILRCGCIPKHNALFYFLFLTMGHKTLVFLMLFNRTFTITRYWGSASI
jgi:hypothetical protein